MNRIDCDQVFEVLTRGPFPTGEAIDRSVERHLATCHECRALAEALRPAMELLHEAIDAEDSRDLPGYYGAPSTSGGLAQLVARAIEAESDEKVVRPKPVPAKQWRDWALASRAETFLAAMAGGVLLVVAMIALQNWTPHTAQRPTVTLSKDGLLTLAALDLKPRCFAWQPGDDVAAVHCCSRCHSVNSRTPTPAPAIALVVANCQTCHAYPVR
jgi:hypothetical protein